MFLKRKRLKRKRKRFSAKESQKPFSKKSRDRKESAKIRKHFPIGFVVSIFFWILIFAIIYFVDPAIQGVIVIFFCILFFALLPLFSIAFQNFRKGLLATTSFVLFLVLRYFGAGNILNLFLIISLAITVEVYLSKNSVKFP